MKKLFTGLFLMYWVQSFVFSMLSARDGPTEMKKSLNWFAMSTLFVKTRLFRKIFGEPICPFVFRLIKEPMSFLLQVVQLVRISFILLNLVLILK